MKPTTSCKLMSNESFATSAESALERTKTYLWNEAILLDMETTEVNITRVLLWEAQNLFARACSKTGESDMGRMQCGFCGSEDNVWLSVNGRCCEACENGQVDRTEEMKEIRRELVEIVKLLDNATVFVQSHTLASYMLTARKRLMVVHRKLKE